MIETEKIAPDILRIVASVKLRAEGFAALAAVVDPILSRGETLRLLIDASHLEGWEDIAAFEKHAGFVKTHHRKVERFAVVVGHTWLHWLVGAVRAFVNPDIRAFDEEDEPAARRWLTA